MYRYSSTLVGQQRKPVVKQQEIFGLPVPMLDLLFQICVNLEALSLSHRTRYMFFRYKLKV